MSNLRQNSEGPPSETLQMHPHCLWEDQRWERRT